MLKLTHAVVLTIFLLASAQTHAQTFAFGGSGAPGIMTLYFADGTSDRVDAIDFDLSVSQPIVEILTALDMRRLILIHVYCTKKI